MEKMRAHSKSSAHIQHSESELLAAKMMTDGSVVQQLHVFGEQERIKNGVGIKSSLRCTHFLTQQHIPHTINYYKVINLIISCGGEDLKNFSERAGRNAS